MKDYNSYFFDIDGTLIDTTGIIYKSCQKVCLKHAGFDPEFGFIASLTGLPLDRVIGNCLDGKCDYDMEQAIRDYKEYQSLIYKDYLKVFPHVNHVLGQLKSRGKKIAAVTSRRLESLKPYLTFTDSLQYFEVLVTPEMTTHHKPHPMPAIKAIDLLKTTPDQCLFIGDSIFDIQCGQKAGTDTAFVDWSFSNIDKLDEGPTYIISDMKELLVN
ncbi:MAG: HAD-IA family hydrolase [Deltaproteobacteria bacterium]|jgi:pyrophosphatase PpaX|nr:HAD-IA family hydrolase [Deltaproteobacteria bacterium]MBT4525581.1 HAD-IA family hydrolase [Deltaproteobacteria bacterium]